MATRKKETTKSVVLTPAEGVTVIALADRRQRVMNEANKQVAGLDEAMRELQALYAQKYSLAEGQFRFRQEGEHLILELEPEPVEEEPSDDAK